MIGIEAIPCTQIENVPRPAVPSQAFSVPAVPRNHRRNYPLTKLAEPLLSRQYHFHAIKYSLHVVPAEAVALSLGVQEILDIIK
jgi:hypothetical protein